jgi:hypothetical protein
LFAELISQIPAQGPTPYEVAAATSADEQSRIEVHDSSFVHGNTEDRDVFNSSRMKGRIYSNHIAKTLDQNFAREPSS